MPDQPPDYVVQKPRGMSCFAKGCLSVAVLVAVLFFALMGGGFYVSKQYGSFFSAHPVPLPANTTTAAQYQAALGKLQPLLAKDGQPAPATIDLTADDLNALVAHDPRLADGKDKCFFAVPGNQLSVDFSSEALSNPNMPNSRSYYYGIRAIGDVKVGDGEIRMTPHKLESFTGQPLPDWLTRNSAFQAEIDTCNEDLNEQIHNNTDLSAMVAKIGSAKIEGGHLLLTVKGPEATPAPAP